jgi:DNA polymerase sigma
LVNNILGVINSKLLSVYAQIPWIKQMGVLFKLWAKSNGVISKDLLSSYATILMMLHFLIQKKYVNLMYNAKDRKADMLKINFKRMKNGYDKPDQFDVFYEFRTKAEEVTTLKTVNMIEIFKELFLYYS